MRYLILDNEFLWFYLINAIENLWSRYSLSPEDCLRNKLYEEHRQIAIISILECSGSRELSMADKVGVDSSLWLMANAAEQLDSLTLWFRAAGR